MSSTSKTAARNPIETLTDEAANLAARRTELAAQHAAEQESIRQRVNAIAEIQAPLNAKLQERTAILERIATARMQLAQQVVLHSAWLTIADQAIGVRDAAHLLNFAQLWKAYAGEANAARVAAEIEAFIARRQAELGNLESEIQNYASTHNLECMLAPADPTNE